MESVVEKIAGAVAGEHAPGAIGAVRGGSEAEDQKLRARVAETGNGFAPVFAIAEGTALFASDGFAVAHQARAFSARHNFFVELLECLQECLKLHAKLTMNPARAAGSQTMWSPESNPPAGRRRYDVKSGGATSMQPHHFLLG